MIVYASNKLHFSKDVRSNTIESKVQDAFVKKLGYGTSKKEIESWRNSLMYMNNIISDDEIPDDAGVAIEYRIPMASKRIDFILTGQNAEKKDALIIVELKQWTEVHATSMDAIVRTPLGNGFHATSHPSYQAWTYASLLQNFSKTVQEGEIAVHPCAYLHNCVDGSALMSDFYSEHLKQAPVFLRTDVDKLVAFFKKHIKYGDQKGLLYQIDGGQIRPSKSLADKVSSMLAGNKEFILIDEQKVVFETCLQLAENSSAKKKNVLIVEGGPGSGKSVVAVNLLAELISRQKNAKYITKNSAPRVVYENKLTGSFRKSQISNLFGGTGSFSENEDNIFDVLIVDEAHRLNEKSGLYQNQGLNQVKEIIDAAFTSIFFIDENQRIALKDIGTKEEILKWAKAINATVTELVLPSQFRCNGSDGYLAWLDNHLGVKETANVEFGDFDYNFSVFDSPSSLKNAIVEANKKSGKARLVAGYCWDWKSKKDKRQFDIELDRDFKMKWNLTEDGGTWLLKEHSIEQVGCIHTCQGLELDYVGVIMGPDFVIRDGKAVTVPAARSKQDQTIKGLKKLAASNPEEAAAKADYIIKNTYRTLMTRGMKGCFFYSTDRETREHFKSISVRGLS